MTPHLPPPPRPDPSPLWEAVRGALAVALVFLGLAVAIGGCWALRW